MKVLMIGNIPCDLQSIKGGVESAIINLLGGFAKLDSIHVIVISFHKSLRSSTSFPFSKNIEIFYFPSTRIKLWSVLFYQRKHINKIIQEFHPDLIHFQGSGPRMLSLLGVPRSTIVITLHGIMKEELKYQMTLFNKTKLLFKSLVDKFYLPHFRHFIFISRYNRNQVQFTCAAEVIIPNAISSLFFEITGKNEFSHRMIYTGAINRRKNLMLALKALHELKQRGKVFTLDVVGGTKEPVYKKQIDHFILENNLTDIVRFYGWTSQHTIRELMQQADILILPSRQESLPVSVAEAMAAGKVVIATRVGGTGEMITHAETGFLFEKDNPEQLVSILEGLYNNAVEISRIGTNASRVARERYKPENVANKTLMFYNSVLHPLS
jgi:glycosyltransferase involved in cell wall biosynthesis